MSSGEYCTHWCYHCNRPVWLEGFSSVCPHCNGGFTQPLHEFFGAHTGEGSGSGHTEPSRGWGSGILDTLASIVRPRMSQRVTHRIIGTCPGPRHCPALRFHGPSPVQSYPFHPPGPNPPNFIFHEMPPIGQPPAVGSPNWYPSDAVLHDRLSPVQNRADYDLSELMEHQPSPTERRGPPPAPRAAIDALPTVTITRRHLETDANCPVCQEQFVLGSEAKKMPCNHIYHSGCIVRWLSEHNSCPVCRHVLSSNASPNQRTGDSSRSSRRRGGF